MTCRPDQPDAATGALDEAAATVVRVGALMLTAGDAAFRVREAMRTIARGMGLDPPSMNLTCSSIVATAQRDGEHATVISTTGPPGINAWRIGALEQFVRTVKPATAPREIAAKLARIEIAPPCHSRFSVALAVGGACGAFAFLNGSGAVEMVAAGIGGGIGQWARLRLSGGRLNQYGVAALSAAAASGVYSVVAAVASHLGFEFLRHTSGFISSVLFLVPGVPLVTALLELLQYETLPAVTRFAHAVMIILAAGFGLGIVIAVIGFELTSQPPLEISASLQWLLRAVTSFAAGSGLAMLYNSSWRAVPVVGLLALAGNDMRLLLVDSGVALAPAAFAGALVVGLVSTVVHHHLDEPLIAIAVPGIIIMMPGSYALQALILFHDGRTLDALAAGVLAGFVIGGIAAGLAVARALSGALGSRFGAA